MTPLKTTVEIKAYERAGKECDSGMDPHPIFLLQTHWNRRELVIVCCPDGSKYALLIENVRAALNAVEAAGR